MLITNFYVCPVCGNIIHAVGEGSFSCCGITLPIQEAEAEDEVHCFCVERVEHEYYVIMQHPMTKIHYISFFAYITPDRVQIVKLYPEQNPEARFFIYGKGMLYAYCNKHGLVKTSV
jgi:desulfoferrodoxin